MKIFLRRVPFFTQQLLGWAYLVFWVLKIVSPEIQVQLSHLPRFVYDLLLFVTLNAFIQVLSALRRRKKATQFLSTLPTQFYETVHTLSAMPIAYLSSAKSRRRPTAVRVGGMFVQPAQKIYKRQQSLQHSSGTRCKSVKTNCMQIIRNLLKLISASGIWVSMFTALKFAALT